MAVVAISVGHDEKNQGAKAGSQTTEWRWTQPLAKSIEAELVKRGHNPRVFLRGPLGGYSDKMRDLCDRINRSEPACVVELHFNMGSLKPRTEVLYWPGSAEGARLAAVVAPRVAAAIKPGRPSRIVPQSRSWNSGASPTDDDGDGVPDPQGPPLYLLKWTKAPAIILESHFGDLNFDHLAATNARDSGALGAAVAESICAWLSESSKRV